MPEGTNPSSPKRNLKLSEDCQEAKVRYTKDQLENKNNVVKTQTLKFY